MLNPDGVFLGNYRVNSVGLDLNRMWAASTPWASPTIDAVRRRFLRACASDSSHALGYKLPLSNFAHAPLFPASDRCACWPRPTHIVRAVTFASSWTCMHIRQQWVDSFMLMSAHPRARTHSRGRLTRFPQCALGRKDVHIGASLCGFHCTLNFPVSGRHQTPLVTWSKWLRSLVRLGITLASSASTAPSFAPTHLKLGPEGVRWEGCSRLFIATPSRCCSAHTPLLMLAPRATEHGESPSRVNSSKTVAHASLLWQTGAVHIVPRGERRLHETMRAHLCM